MCDASLPCHLSTTVSSVRVKNNGPKLKVHTPLTPITASPGYVKALTLDVPESVKECRPAETRVEEP